MKKTKNVPPVVGEVFDDGQFRGHGIAVPDVHLENGIKVGRYTLMDSDEDTFYIFFDTGEVGAFLKSDFESHIAAFFGLNF